MCLGRHIHLSTAHYGHTEFTSYTATHIIIRSLYHRPAPVQDRATGHQLHRQTVRTSGKAASRHRTNIFFWPKKVSVKREICRKPLGKTHALISHVRGPNLRHTAFPVTCK